MLSEFPMKGNRIIYYSCVCLCMCVCMCVWPVCFSHSLLLDFFLAKVRLHFLAMYRIFQELFI